MWDVDDKNTVSWGFHALQAVIQVHQYICTGKIQVYKMFLHIAHCVA